MLERTFHLKENGTTVTTEIVAGLVTFMTLCYILFVQPAVLSSPPCNMPAGAVLFATCVASAIACFLMGLLANLPVALAPAMGHNFFFAFMVCGTLGFTWQTALAANFCAGAIFLVLSSIGMREAVMNAIPESLKYAIAVGIGLLIALLGLEWGGLVVGHPALYLTRGDLGHPVVLLTLFGLAVTSVLLCWRVRGAIFFGIVLTTAAGLLAPSIFPGLKTALVAKPSGVVALPERPFEAFFKLDFAGLFDREFLDVLTVLFIFLFLDLFDTVGTLVGVAERANLLKDGKLPRARQALFSDAVGTTVGTLVGTSTVTSYIESTAGVSTGGRTGLTAFVVGLLFIAGLFFWPVIEVIGAGVVVTVQGAGGNMPGQPDQFHWYPIIAPVLIIVGAMMMTTVTKIKWDDYTEAIPAFLTIVIMQTAVNITEGIAWGFISFALLKFVTGKVRDAHWLLYVFAVLFVLRYVFLTA